MPKFNLPTLLKAFRRDESGQFAVWTALLGVPMIMGVGIAIDMENKNRRAQMLTSALDTASFAAVLSPAVMASSTRRRKVRTEERRALLTAVLRAILRTFFLAEDVFAMC